MKELSLMLEGAAWSLRENEWSGNVASLECVLLPRVCRTRLDLPYLFTI